MIVCLERVIKKDNTFENKKFSYNSQYLCGDFVLKAATTAKTTTITIKIKAHFNMSQIKSIQSLCPAAAGTL